MSVRHKQLTFAREYRGYTQTELSSSISGLSQSNLSKFEKGLKTLSDELLVKIVDFLDFPIEFLNKNISNRSETALYRKRTTIKKKEKTFIEHSYRLIGYIIDEMEELLLWPEFALKAFDIEDGYSPEYIASYTRKLLDLRLDEPVREIYSLLERRGIIIVELNTIDKFDGVSFVSDKGFPVIVVNSNFPNDRKRFTIAHELGHLIMHSINHPAIPEHRNKAKELEREANSFASEFLMPSDSIRGALYDLRLGYLTEMKRYWLTSMASIMMRAKTLGCISEERYKYLNIEFSRRGYKRKEEIDVYIDQPLLFRKGYLMHKNELAYTDLELANAFSLPQDVVKFYCDFPKNRTKLRVLT